MRGGRSGSSRSTSPCSRSSAPPGSGRAGTRTSASASFPTSPSTSPTPRTGPSDRSTPFGYSWSLACEEQFYLLWPPVLVWLGTRGATASLVGASRREPGGRARLARLGSPPHLFPEPAALLRPAVDRARRPARGRAAFTSRSCRAESRSRLALGQRARARPHGRGALVARGSLLVFRDRPRDDARRRRLRRPAAPRLDSPAHVRARSSASASSATRCTSSTCR